MALQVFISYKSEYRDFAVRLRDQLRTWGFGTWLDRDDIEEGTYYRHAIQNGLETSSVVVGLLTPEALQSREVMWEWDYALHNSRLIPLKYRECTLPYHLQGTQHIDFTAGEGQGFEQLHAALTDPTLLVKPAVAPPAIVAQASPPPRSKTVLTNRERMLQKVHNFWIAGVLDHVLRESGVLDLELHAAPGAVLKHIDYGDYQLPGSARIGDIFKDMNRELLILGAPGSGKTVLLLQLARDLITRAQENGTLAIPVVFNLSSWAMERKPLAEWLVDELRSRYQVPRRVAREWVEGEQLLLLLDGLDEVAEAQRNACVDAINHFRQRFRSVDVAVCSRIADYELLTSKLDLRGAIVLKPLTPEQVSGYLNSPELASLRAVLPTDPLLQNMAGTPFLLNTMAYAYREISVPGLSLPVTADPIAARRDHLFEHYVERRLSSQSNKKYPPNKVRHYLGWLAQNMTARSLTTFYIEDMQPDWLGKKLVIYDWLIAMIIGIPIWGFVGFILLNNWGLLGLVIGAVMGTLIYYSLRARRRHIRIWEGFQWSWSRIRWRLVGIGLITGVIFGALLVWTTALIITVQSSYVDTIGDVRLDYATLDLLSGVVMGGILGAGVGVGLSGIQGKALDMRDTPNQGITRSRRTGMQIGCLVVVFINIVLLGLVTGSSVFVPLTENRALGWPILLCFTGFIAPLIGVLFAFSFGLYTVIQHGILRLVLRFAGYTPGNYARFLDHAAEMHILRKVGGGYIFIHRYLLDYFAEQYKLAERI